jgi:hypothetical protein
MTLSTLIWRWSNPASLSSRINAGVNK